MTMTQKIITLGKTEKNELVNLPINVLKRHVVVLGASGSGKTVISKCIVEEAVRNSIPAIIIDPQGDFASLGIINDRDTVLSHGTSPSILQEYADRSEVRIFTPASSKGLALSIDPMKLPPSELLFEEAVLAIDVASIDLTGLMGFNIQSDEGDAVKNYLYSALENAWRSGLRIKDLAAFLAFLSEPSNLNLQGDLITDRLKEKVKAKLQYLSTGMNQLLFDFGTQFDMNIMMTPIKKGHVPINIIYLNTLTSDIHKQFFVSSIGREIYNWMLKNPDEHVQLLFCIDEVAPYLPPHPNNPPAKTILKMLFKQARKYGISCLMCTQNPADIDYKAMAQANTWILGRLMAKQDLAKVGHMLKGEEQNILDQLPTLKSGEFVLICPDVYEIPVHMRMRWLVTKHKTLDDDSLARVMSDEVMNYFKVPIKITSSELIIDSSAAPLINDTKSPTHNLMFQMNYPQTRAIKNVRSYLEGSMFKKTEKVVNGTLKLVPIWQVRCNVDQYEGPILIPLIRRKVTVEGKIYFSALHGEFLTLKDGSMSFLKVLSGDINRIKDLDVDKIQLVESAYEDNIGTIMQPKITAIKAVNLAKAIFGVEVIDTQLVRLPIWKFTVESKTGKKRTILLDAMLGKKVTGIELKS